MTTLAYYAVFHMMQAALLTKQKTFSKHTGVISGFSEHFIKPGIFQADFALKIQRLRRDRELGDYGYTLTVDASDAREDAEIATGLVSAIKVYVTEFTR